ncbi:hypothetical protein EV426DRAFT_708570 [Tirmania nivea]|nr:hypothetical protein EV426DRAFT_708570 [Tirmania nivea]
MIAEWARTPDQVMVFNWSPLCRTTTDSGQQSQINHDGHVILPMEQAQGDLTAWLIPIVARVVPEVLRRSLLEAVGLSCASARLYYNRKLNESDSKGYFPLRRNLLEKLLKELTFISPLLNDAMVQGEVWDMIRAGDGKWLHVNDGLASLFFHCLKRPEEWQKRGGFSALLEERNFASKLGWKARGEEVFSMEVILSVWKKSGCWPIDLDYAHGFSQTPFKPTSSSYVADTPGRMKQIVTEINAELTAGATVVLKEKFQACIDFMIQKVTKYRDIEKRSATLKQLRSGKTVKTATSRAYIGKGRMLTQKEVDQGIAKLLKRKEDEQVAAVRRAEKVAAKKASDEVKAICKAEYQAACDAALAGGLPKPKRPRVPVKAKAVKGGGGASRGGGGGSRRGFNREGAGRGGASRRGGGGRSRGGGQVVTEINIEAGDGSEELDEVEIEEQQRVLQIREFFEGLE